MATSPSGQASASGQEPAAGASMRRVIPAALIGSALEWYDFYLYAVASALVFNKVVFPVDNEFIGTLAAFSTLALGYFIRPLGGALFGSLGDRVGRRHVLVITLLVMGGATVLMAFLPTYEQAGFWSPAMLLVLRLVQGLGAGAEFGGSAVMSVEFARPRRRGLHGAWPASGVYLGLLLASAAMGGVASLPHDAFLSWGWRLPFAASVVVIGLALFIRLRLQESPAFKEVEREGEVMKAPLREVLTHERRGALVLIGTQVAQSVMAYLFLTFITAYVTDTLHMDDSAGPFAVTVGAAVALVTMPLFGALSDRVGRRPVLLFGTVFCAVYAFPFFWIIDSTRSRFGLTTALVIGLGLGVGAMFGPQGAYFAELFSARIRMTGLTFSREVGGALAGGLTPIIALSLVEWTGGSSWAVALFAVLACVVIGLPAVLLGPETRGRSLLAPTRAELEASTGLFEEAPRSAEADPEAAPSRAAGAAKR
ncbi:MFS transporter [Streptomyces sp. NBC_00338]|uniref:MFS transporter n=1 Tax=Streptomyces sp. NBC_00338 TaxID=2975715 RepID=UPI0022594F8F|nr:MFS transporter [Streptomyces sp. NBC_00338]MCX5141593.1 MHS family MFS transporter [Streptomyces sp. NBC_00338]